MNTFLSSVSVTGLSRLSSKSRVSCCIWFVLILFATGFLAYHMYNRIQYYRSNPVMASVDIKYTTKEQFPCVTICNVNPIRSTYMVSNLGKSASLRGQRKKANTSNRRTIVRSVKKSTNHALGQSRRDLKYFVRKASHQFGDMVLECKWEEHNCTSDSFRTTHTDHSLCYTFNPKGSLHAQTTGIGSGLSLLLNVEDHLYSDSVEEVGFRIVLHDADEIPNVRRDAFSIGSGVITNVALKKSVLVNLPEPFGNCGERALRYFPSGYSLSKCRLECFTNFTNRYCGCKFPYMPGQDHPYCDPFSPQRWERCMETHKDWLAAQPLCDCPNSCEEVVYKRTITVTHFSKTGRPRSNVSVNRLARLRIYYDQHLHYMIIEHEKAYTWLALLADMGGAMGLMLGCCFFTLAQIVEFVLRALITKFARYSKNGERLSASGNHSENKSIVLVHERKVDPLVRYRAIYGHPREKMRQWRYSDLEIPWQNYRYRKTTTFDAKLPPTTV